MKIMKLTKMRILLLIIAATGLYLVINAGGANELSLEFIASHRAEIEAIVENNFLLAGLVYTGTYVLLLGLGMPFGALMSVIGGFFFGLYSGMAVVMISAMLAASLTYWMGRRLLYGFLKRRYERRVSAIEREVQKEGVYYLLAMRLSSVLPFFWINLLFGASGIGWFSYLWPTFIGLIPGTLVYLNLGRSLSNLESIEGLFKVEIAISFLLLGLIAILPVVVRKLRTLGRKEQQPAA